MIAVTRMLLASIWHLNEEKTWFRWVLARDSVACWRKALMSEFRITRSEIAEKWETKRNVCWDEECIFWNLSCLLSLSAFFSFDSVSRRVVRKWIFPESDLRAASYGPATLSWFGGAIFWEGCVSPLGCQGIAWLCRQIVGPRQWWGSYCGRLPKESKGLFCRHL